MTEVEVLAARNGYNPYLDGENMSLYSRKYRSLTVNTETGIAVIALEGSWRSKYASWFGRNLYASLKQEVEECLKLDEIKSIILHMDSPGGEVLGCFEACRYLQQAREIKPIYCLVEGQCCSAAYAIGTSCTKLYATEFSEIGSVGVLAQIPDNREWEKKTGFLTRTFRSRNAQKKAVDPLSAEGEKQIQTMLDKYEDDFYSILSENRKISKDTCMETFGQGLVFNASEALEKGMIDGIKSYESLISDIASSPEESKGEDMVEISKLKAEEQTQLFADLTKARPDLLSDSEQKAKAAEGKRLKDLYAIRNDKNAAAIDAAIENGKTAQEISYDLYLTALNEQKAEPPAAPVPSATTDTPTPAPAVSTPIPAATPVDPLAVIAAQAAADQGVPVGPSGQGLPEESEYKKAVNALNAGLSGKEVK